LRNCPFARRGNFIFDEVKIYEYHFYDFAQPDVHVRIGN
jgi:hypothetical protein